MTAIQFGCGGNHFPDWQNYDMDVDITKPLPFDSEIADFVYCSHTAEHVSGPDCFRFFSEVHRILKSDGVFRVVVPSIEQVLELADENYIHFIETNGWGQNPIQNLVCNHGHLIFFSFNSLKAMLWGAGFRNIFPRKYNQSPYPELCNKEWHGKVIGEHNDKIESLIFEAKK